MNEPAQLSTDECLEIALDGTSVKVNANPNILIKIWFEPWLANWSDHYQLWEYVDVLNLLIAAFFEKSSIWRSGLYQHYTHAAGQVQYCLPALMPSLPRLQRAKTLSCSGGGLAPRPSARLWSTCSAREIMCICACDWVLYGHNNSAHMAVLKRTWIRVLAAHTQFFRAVFLEILLSKTHPFLCAITSKLLRAHRSTTKLDIHVQSVCIACACAHAQAWGTSANSV